MNKDKIKRISVSNATRTISDIYKISQSNEFDFKPKYQRKSMWNDEQKSFLIDSIIKNYPIPPIFLHRKIDADTGKQTFDVVDGKQRLTAIISFIQGKLQDTT